MTPAEALLFWEMQSPRCCAGSTTTVLGRLFGVALPPSASLTAPSDSCALPWALA